ncbi:MAG: hypothetical protein AB7V59_10235 [Gammaproteobacteria bacterium]
MVTPQLQEQVAAAQAYEDLFVPGLFRQWAPTLAQAARIARGKRVLDEADRALRGFADAQGRAVFQVSAHVLSGGDANTGPGR